MPSAWDLATSDPVLAAEIRDRYRGRGDPLDQLWWIEHPGTPTPRGGADPAIAAEAARRSRYTRDGGASGTADPGAAALDPEVDRDAARQALSGALLALRVRSDVPRVAPARRRSRVGMLLAVVAAFVAGAGVVQATERLAPGLEERATRVFDREQRADDRLEGAGATGGAVASTTRLLRTLGSVGTAVYAARSADGQVCLIAVVGAASPVAACTTPDSFARGGLSLTVEAQGDPVDLAGHRPAADLRLRWSPDGAVRADPVPSG